MINIYFKKMFRYTRILNPIQSYTESYSIVY